MPTYEYLCQTCSHRFETWQKMTDEPLTTCPECGAQIRRVLFPSSIVFKGSGFYKTDHNSNGSSTAASSDGDNKKTEAATGSNGDNKKTETGSNGEAKKAESSTSSNTSTSESKSTTTTATK
jgi:putative FmdB family regulatory protein